LDSPSRELVDEIWAWEAVQHGDSALLNGDSLGYLSTMDFISQILLMTTSLQLIGQIMGVIFSIFYTTLYLLLSPMPHYRLALDVSIPKRPNTD